MGETAGARGRAGRRPSCGPRSCSVRRTISSTASPRSRGSSPALPLIGGGQTRFQPVFVGDVARAIAARSTAAPSAGTIYELGGPEVKSFKELMEYVLADQSASACCVPLPFALAKLQA